MPDYGITDKGFRRKTYSILESEMRAKAKELFGEDIDLSKPNPQTMLIQLMAWARDEDWQVYEDVYLSGTPAYATGESLSNHGSNIGLPRRAAQRATGYIEITAPQGVQIPAYARFSNTAGVVYQTTQAHTVADGELSVYVESLETGNHTNSLPNSVINIDTVITVPPGETITVTNKDAIMGGADVETDAEFYARYLVSTTRGGGSTAQAVKAALLGTGGVVDADVLENVTEETVDGIPPKSIAPYVYGGDDATVGKTILLNKAGGIRSYGSTEIEVPDDDETLHTIGFTRVKEQKVHVKLTFPGTVSEPVIKRAIVNYIGGVDDDNIKYSGLGLGKPVTLSGVIGAVMCLGGIPDVSAELSTDGSSWSQSNIEIPGDTVAVTDFESIVIAYD